MKYLIEDIIIASLSGEELTSEEKELFDKWISDKKNKETFIKISRYRKLSKKIFEIDEISTDIKLEDTRTKIKRLSSYKRINFLKYAAVIIFPIMMISAIYYMFFPFTNKSHTIAKQDRITPGKQQAKLVLSNGQEISLSDSLGFIVNSTETLKSNSKNTNLVYNSDDSDSTELEKYNTIYTPKGGVYNLILSDGTKVYLNSKSTLKYPVKFIGSNRSVFLKGEAYFKVAKDKTKPFKVYTKNTVTEVLGTVFNINSYEDEGNVKTVLVEGSVKVKHRGNQNNEITLKPGQMAEISRNKIDVQKVDTECLTLWQKGIFCFNNQPLSEIFKQLERWYDIQVFYLSPSVKDYRFTAWFNKYEDIGKVINKLKMTNKIDIRLKGKTITISKVKR